MTRYRVGTDIVQLHSGVLFRQQRQARLDRLQAVDVVQPLLGRIFGLSELKLEVAGGAGSDVKLSYLRDSDAQRLRGVLLAQAAGVGFEGDEAPEAPEDELVQVSPGRLVGSLALSGGTIGAVLGLVGLVIASFFQPAVLFGALPVVLGTVSAYWTQFTGGFGFRVAASPDGLRLRHGLLETRAQTVPPGRVQAVQITQGLLWRGRDWWKVQVNVAGYGVGADGQDKETVLLPVATRGEAYRVLSVVLPDLGHPDPLRLLEAGLVGTSGDGEVDDAGYVGAPRQARWLDPWAWRRHGVAVTERALLLRSGRWGRRLVLVPHERTQSLGLAQGPVQRRLGLASVVAHSTPGPVSPRVDHLDAGTAARLLHEQAERARQARAGSGPERWMEQRRTAKEPTPPVDLVKARLRTVSRRRPESSEPRQHHRRPGLVHALVVAHGLQHALEVRHVGRAHVQHRVGLAGDGERRLHLGDVGHHRPDPGGGDPAVAEDLDERLDRPAQGGGVDHGGEGAHDAVGAHPVDPALDRRRAQPDLGADHLEAASGVLEQ